jgi:soluble lytic murein transglycosylase-like protein
LRYLRHICTGFLNIGYLLFAVLSPVYADIYRYIDNEGVIHFTNAPTSSAYTVFIRERPEKSLSRYSTDKYDHIIAEASKKHEISFSLLKALIKVESNFDARAVSRAGAMGLMQIMPENLETLHIKDPFDPLESIMGGACYFKKLLRRYDGRLPLALAAYNAGPERVDRLNGIPPIRETEDYVRSVLKYYYIFKESSRRL